jgi:MFS family permease
MANIGSTSGVLLASAVAAAAVTFADKAQLESWMWRLPFLLGGVLATGALLLRRRLRLDGTPPTHHGGRHPVRARHQEQAAHGLSRRQQTYKVHLYGYNLLPYLKGEAQESPRKEFLYWSDDGDLVALRFQNWKLIFAEQRADGFDVWQEPFVQLRLPKLFNLRSDPFERADPEGFGYPQWRAERLFVLLPAQAFVANWLSSFKDFPAASEARVFQPGPGHGEAPERRPRL